MLRLIHNQTTQGPLLVDDIDDGLPNKTAHRLGSEGNPKAYARDGYANSPKQACYLPRIKKGDSVAGYIDLAETSRVTLSAGKGKIQGFRRANLITVVQFLKSDVLPPTVVSAVLGGGNLTVTGTNLTSLMPDITKLIVTGTGAITLSAPAVIAAGGSLNATTMVIPVALLPGVVATTSFVKILSDNATSTAVAVS